MKNSLILLILTVPLMGCHKHSHSTSALLGNQRSYTFVAFGQSNMRGTAIEPFTPVSGITINYDTRGTAYSFAMALEDDTDATINIIECAKYASPLESYVPGGEAYDRCMADIKAAGHIDGMLLWQGEGEATGFFSVAEWNVKFKTLTDYYRSILGNIPMMYCQLGVTTHPDVYPDLERVKQLQASCQGSRNLMIVTDDIENPLVDEIHYKKEAVLEVGRRMYKAFKAING